MEEAATLASLLWQYWVQISNIVNSVHNNLYYVCKSKPASCHPPPTPQKKKQKLKWQKDCIKSEKKSVYLYAHICIHIYVTEENAPNCTS